MKQWLVLNEITRVKLGLIELLEYLHNLSDIHV